MRTDDCLCNAPRAGILDALLSETLPDSALTNYCCWRTICRVRGFWMCSIDGALWERTCRRRGTLGPEPRP